MEKDKSKWFEWCFESWRHRVKENQEFLQVGIARKALRMLEHEVKFGHLDDIILDKVVSEYALPFVLNKPINRLSVVDDAIYYGTTFEGIVSLIQNTYLLANGTPLTADNIIANPVIRSQEMKSISKVNLDGIPIASKEAIPYYIEKLVSSFLKLKKPFDIEFPIIYFKWQNTPKSSEEIIIILKKIFGEEANVYEITHYDEQGNTFKNYSIVFTTTLNKQKGNIEFAKFRIYTSNDYIAVTTYAPHFLNEKIVSADSEPFIHNIFNKLWKIALNVSSLNQDSLKEMANDKYLINKSDINTDYEWTWTNQVEEIIMFRNKCLIILANYFYSIEFLVHTKWKEIDSLVKELGLDPNRIQLDRFDLQLLIGPELATQFIQELNLTKMLEEQGQCTHSMPHSATEKNTDLQDAQSVAIDAFLQEDVIPPIYKDEYNLENQLEWGKCESVAEALSCMFNNMHLYVEIASRGNYPDNYSRLRFGVSYDSIRKDLLPYFPVDDFTCQVHQWMDKSIDEGSVVPKYDRVSINGNYYWRRLFRAGENENKFLGQLIRTSLFIFNEITKTWNSEFVEKDLVENIFALLFSRQIGTQKTANMHYLSKIKWDDSIEWGTSCYKVHFYIDENKSISLIDYLYRHHIFQKDEDFLSLIYLSKTPFVTAYRKGNTLESETEDELSKNIKVLVHILKNLSFEERTGLINHILCKRENIDYHKTTELRLKMVRLLESADIHTINKNDFDELKTEIDLLFIRTYCLGQTEMSHLANKYEIQINLQEETNELKQYNKELFLLYQVSRLMQALLYKGNTSLLNHTLKEIKNKYPNLTKNLSETINNEDKYTKDYVFHILNTNISE